MQGVKLQPMTVLFQPLFLSVFLFRFWLALSTAPRLVAVVGKVCFQIHLKSSGNALKYTIYKMRLLFNLDGMQMLNISYCICQTCFQNGIIPCVWNKSIIKPSPKFSKADPRASVNRGISLISTIYKLYYVSSIIGSIIIQSLMVDEQNGLGKNSIYLSYLYDI